jgi:hypothetical protein
MNFENRVFCLAMSVTLSAACGGTREHRLQPAADTGSIAVDGIRLPYRIVGTGRPCLVFGSHI